MIPGYAPSKETVRDHLAHLSATAHLPRWQRGDASLELLLGLRDAVIDQQLLLLAPRLERTNDGFALGPDDVNALVTDTSEERVASIIGRTCSALALAWCAATSDEALRLLDSITRFMLDRAGTWGVPSGLFVSACELAVRSQLPIPSDLRGLTPDRWVEEQAASGALFVAREWPPPLPQALVRDPLTGLLSRSTLARDPHRFRLPDGSEIVAFPKKEVVVLDVDRMKHVLDVYGMRSGDGVLRGIADALQRALGDIVIRYGGDEFLVFCEHAEGPRVALAAVEAVRNANIRCFEAPDERIAATVSAGIGTGATLSAALRAAERGLEKAKRGGRDRVEEG